MIFDLNHETIRNHAAHAEFGIERESLRVNSDGTLAQTPHPFVGNPHIDRDFCENQVEMIGDVFEQPDDLERQLHAFQNEINAALAGNQELLWPFSNPPKISGEGEIPVARFVGSQQGKSAYRNYLAAKYGKKKMLFSGIHLNFSFSKGLLEASFSHEQETDFTDYQNGVYLRLAKRLTQYAWLVVFLTASSPVTDSSLGIESNVYVSPRCSEKGYWNDFTPILDYSNLKAYAESVESYIKSGMLASASELYYPVRVKPRGTNSLDALKVNGINHIELRVFDVNPLSRTGIFTEDIRFIHLLMLYLSSFPDFDFDKDAQSRAIADIKSAAEFNNMQIKMRAREALASISDFASRYFPVFQSVVTYQKEKLKEGRSYAEIISARYSENYMNRGLELARAYQRSVGNV